MSVTYTEDQQKVIDLRDCNILVSAAAGSGKTAVLTERIVQRICDKSYPLQIDRMLIVTFTNAAAAEMKERIGTALRKRLEQEPENVHLRKQITLLNHAQITTIHSFCLYLLRNHFHEIQLDPAFRIADEGEIKLLKEETLEEFLEGKYEEAEEEFLDFVEKYAGNGREDSLRGMLLRIYEFVCSHPFPELYIKECIAVLEEEKEQLSPACMEFLAEYENGVLAECVSMTKQALLLCDEPGGPLQYKEALEDDLTFYESFGADLSFIGRAAKYNAHKYMTLSRKKIEEPDIALQEKVKELRNTSKKIVEDIRSKFYYDSAEQILADSHKAGQTLAYVLKLVEGFRVIFDEKKREKNIVDFSDMEHLALHILLKWDGEKYVPGEVAKAYRDYFQEIMVDEYQDSNMVQELLLESISHQTSESGNRFMVGDVKQSIYRFRLARPEIFMEKYSSFDSKEGKNRRVNLSKNFRSRKEVLEGINGVFEELMIPQVGKVSYDDDAKLYYGADYIETDEDYNTEILLYDKDEFKEKDIRSVEAEAHIIAQRIRELCKEFQVTDKSSKELRPAKFSDMVILLRAATGVDDVMKKVLEEENIPVYISSGKGYFSAPEIQVILNYITIINNPRQDIPLLGVLHSPLGKFTEEEIAKARVFNRKKGLLYDSLVAYAQTGGRRELAEKIASFLEELEQWRQKAVYMTVCSLLEEILDETGYLQYCTAMPGGQQRRANLLVLLQKAKAYEGTGYSGLFDFIRYMEMIKERDIDFGEANVLDESANVVRIMTIHKSKGLEFPICFVAGFSKQFNRRESAEAVLTDADLGPGSDYIDLTLRCRRKSIRKNIIAVKQKNDARGEDLRVLYVAMTRAKEKLILVGAGDISDENQKDIGVYTILNAKSFMDLVLPIALRKKELFSCRSFTTEDIEAGNVADALETKVLKEALKNISPEPIWEPYVYPHDSLEGLYTKTTVSELKKAAYLEEEEICHELYAEPEIVPYVPGFIAKKEEETGGSRRGSAYHRVMELMDFSLAFCTEDMEERICELRQKNIDELRIPATEDALVSCRKVYAFMQTDLARRMGTAQEKGKLYREQPFVLGVKASDVCSDFPEDEDILVQGVIDVYFEEEDGLVLMDYKTDRVEEGSELIKRYRTQLDYYAEALERLTHKKVKEKLIYSFALHAVIKV